MLKFQSSPHPTNLKILLPIYLSHKPIRVNPVSDQQPFDAALDAELGRVDWELGAALVAEAGQPWGGVAARARQRRLRAAGRHLPAAAAVPRAAPGGRAGTRALV